MSEPTPTPIFEDAAYAAFRATAAGRDLLARYLAAAPDRTTATLVVLSVRNCVTAIDSDPVMFAYLTRLMTEPAFLVAELTGIGALHQETDADEPEFARSRVVKGDPYDRAVQMGNERLGVNSWLFPTSLIAVRPSEQDGMPDGSLDGVFVVFVREQVLDLDESMHRFLEHGLMAVDLRRRHLPVLRPADRPLLEALRVMFRDGTVPTSIQAM